MSNFEDFIYMDDEALPEKTCEEITRFVKEYKQKGAPQEKWNRIMSIYNKSRCNESLHLKNGRCN